MLNKSYAKSFKISVAFTNPCTKTPNGREIPNIFLDFLINKLDQTENPRITKIIPSFKKENRMIFLHRLDVGLF